MNDKNIPILAIIGHKNSGKTRLICSLLKELSARGLAVATIKHAPHLHWLDVPGSDSYRHQQAGSRLSGLITAEGYVLFCKGDAKQAPLEQMLSYFKGFDLLIIEGGKEYHFPKVEAYLFKDPPPPPLCTTGIECLAVVSDLDIKTDIQHFKSDQIQAIADFIVHRFLR